MRAARIQRHETVNPGTVAYEVAGQRLLTANGKSILMEKRAWSLTQGLQISAAIVMQAIAEEDADNEGMMHDLQEAQAALRNYLTGERT